MAIPKMRAFTDCFNIPVWKLPPNSHYHGYTNVEIKINLGKIIRVVFDCLGDSRLSFTEEKITLIDFTFLSRVGVVIPQ